MDKMDFMRSAIELAREKTAEGVGAPFGTVVVKDGEIIGEGWNNTVQGHDPTGHCEVNAMRDACQRLGTWDLSGCELYTSFEPCSLCVAAIWWARISRVYYACPLEWANKAGFELEGLLEDVSSPPDRRSVPYEKLLSDESWAVVEAWANDPNKALF